MKIFYDDCWVYYVCDDYVVGDRLKNGKWMYFFDDRKFVEKICKMAIKQKIVKSLKFSNDEKGVVCFYMNGEDVLSHKRVLAFFLSNDLIRHRKNGNLYNVAFKFDHQTRSDEYGENFKAQITLSQFVDLATGEFKI